MLELTELVFSGNDPEADGARETYSTEMPAVF